MIHHCSAFKFLFIMRVWGMMDAYVKLINETVGYAVVLSNDNNQRLWVEMDKNSMSYFSWSVYL